MTTAVIASVTYDFDTSSLERAQRQVQALEERLSRLQSGGGSGGGGGSRNNPLSSFMETLGRAPAIAGAAVKAIAKVGAAIAGATIAAVAFANAQAQVIREVFSLTDGLGVARSQMVQFSEEVRRTTGQTIEQTADMVETFTENLGEMVRDGTGPFEDWITTVGELAPAALQRMDDATPIEAMKIFIDTLVDSGASTKQVLQATQSAADGMGRFALAVKDGTASLEDLDEKYINFARSVSQDNAMLRLSDAGADAKQSFENLATALITRVGPALESLLSWVTDIVNMISVAFSTAQENAEKLSVKQLEVAISTDSTELDRVQRQIEDIESKRVKQNQSQSPSYLYGTEPDSSNANPYDLDAQRLKVLKEQGKELATNLEINRKTLKTKQEMMKVDTGSSTSGSSTSSKSGSSGAVARYKREREAAEAAFAGERAVFEQRLKHEREDLANMKLSNEERAQATKDLAAKQIAESKVFYTNEAKARQSLANREQEQHNRTVERERTKNNRIIEERNALNQRIIDTNNRTTLLQTTTEEERLRLSAQFDIDRANNTIKSEELKIATVRAIRAQLDSDLGRLDKARLDKEKSAADQVAELHRSTVLARTETDAEELERVHEERIAQAEMQLADSVYLHETLQNLEEIHNAEMLTLTEERLLEQQRMYEDFADGVGGTLNSLSKVAAGGLFDIPALAKDMNKAFISMQKSGATWGEATVEVTGQVAGAIQQGAEEGSAAWKAAAIVNATISAYQAINTTLASLPAPYNMVMAGIIGGMALGNVAKIVASANGNVFSGGNVQAFANGGAFTNTVANKPTMAPMALFGEAGPEAIMPLKRGKDGKLGVASSGGSGGGGVSVGAIHISMNESDNNEDTTEAVRQGVLAAMKEIARNEIHESQRTGGTLNPLSIQEVF